MARRFPTLSDDERDRVGARLLLLANQGRRRTLRGETPGYFDRWLGPVVAPTHLLRPGIWSQPRDVPDEPFVTVRVYNERWSTEARRRDPAAVQLVLSYEYSSNP